MFREKKRTENSELESAVYIDQYCSPREVQNWLVNQGFSDKYESVLLSFLFFFLNLELIVFLALKLKIFKTVLRLNIFNILFFYPNRTFKHLRGMTGAELFSLSRRDLEHYCGVEWRKLNEELTRSRNASSVSKLTVFLIFIFLVKLKINLRMSNTISG